MIGGDNQEWREEDNMRFKNIQASAKMNFKDETYPEKTKPNTTVNKTVRATMSIKILVDGRPRTIKTPHIHLSDNNYNTSREEAQFEIDSFKEDNPHLENIIHGELTIKEIM